MLLLVVSGIQQSESDIYISDYTIYTIYIYSYCLVAKSCSTLCNPIEYIYIYIYIYIHTHTHIYIYIYSFLDSLSI